MPAFFWRIKIFGLFLPSEFSFSGMLAKILDTVRELAEPIVTEHNLELVDIEHHRDSRGWVLRITLDKENGVTLDDCTKISKELGTILEVRDVISYPYHLEVSSPGLGRPLKTLRDFEKHLGRKVAIKTSALLNGRRNFKGTLQSIQDGNVYLDIEGNSWEIPFTTINQAKLIYEFPEKFNGM